MSIFNSKTIENQLVELKSVPFEIKMLRGSLSLEQTKRNNMRRELVEGFVETLKTLFENNEGVNVYETAEGIAIEVENDSVIASESHSGFITLLLDLSVQNLEYDAYEASEIWLEDKQRKKR